MKAKNIVYIALVTLAFGSCTLNNSKQELLYKNTWELIYISGQRIAFNGLYPDKKPTIRFDKETTKVIGNNSCNGYNANFTINDNLISFGEPGPTTMMFCGNGEKQFLAMMKKINAYDFDEDGNLALFFNKIPMMRFKKIAE